MAQMKQVFYFKNNGLQVNEADSSDYIRVVSPPDSGSVLFNVTEYYRNGKPKLVSKSSSINPPVFEGQCITYSPNGKRQSVLNYTEGNLVGTNYIFHPNGKLYLQVTSDTVKSRTFEENMRIITCMDSTGKELVTAGNGHFISYDGVTHAINEEGEIKDGKRVGEWHGSYSAEKVTYVDTYQDGKFVSGICTAASGAKYTYISKNQSPEFTGGANAFITMIKKKVKTPATLKNKSVQMFLSFNIDKNGKLNTPTLLGSLSPEADKAIIAAMNSSPVWKPRIYNGLPVDTSWGMPLTFGTVAPVAKAKAK